MRPHVLACSVFLLGFAVLGGEGRTITKRQVKFGGAIDPGYEHHGDDAYRDKRKVEAKFGIKNAILGLVFHPTSYTPTTTTKKPTTTEDIVIFEKNKPVSVQVPSELFGSSYTLVTNVSQKVSDFMLNSAERLQKLLESMRPFLRFVFGAKGVVIEGTGTKKPIFSDGSDTSDNSLRR